MKKILSIIIPCYNEEDSLPHLFNQLSTVIRKIKKIYKIELIFVDDGSTDKTYKILTKFKKNNKNVKILRHKRNMNIGAAMRTGFRYASGDIIVTIDSDCTYDPKEIPNIVRELNGADIVTASPYMPGGKVINVKPHRLFLSNIVSRIYSILVGKKIYTFTSIFRAYKKETAKTIKFKSNNFLSLVEILINSLERGKRVVEYPTTLKSRLYGQSKMKLFKTIKSHMKFMMFIVWRKNENSNRARYKT